MEITSIVLSTDNSTLDIVITNAAILTNLRLWTTATFKDYDQAVSLNSFLTGASTENISISPLDIGQTFFNGIYFIEAEDNIEVSLKVLGVLTTYKACLIQKILSLGVCVDCLDNKSDSIKNAHILLRSLEDAIELGFIDEILTIDNALSLYCSDDCNNCGNYSDIENGSYYTINS